MVTVNESGTGAGAKEGAVGAPATTATSGIEADVVDTVPKTMQGKARRLMEHLKGPLAANLSTRVCRFPEVTWWIS